MRKITLLFSTLVLLAPANDSKMSAARNDFSRSETNDDIQKFERFLEKQEKEIDEEIRIRNRQNPSDTIR
jgi:hypothetical protein